MERKDIAWFEECRKDHTALVGGKCASLGELLAAEIRVPPGFAVTTEAYYHFLTVAGIKDPICKVLRRIRDGVPIHQVGEETRQMVLAAPIPGEVERAIRAAYRELCDRCGVEDLPVAVRSSATLEDMADASFAGQQDTYLWVRGEDEVVDKVKRCWASLFSDRVIAYREEKGFTHENVRISVGIQKMVRSRASGVLFTLNPLNGDRSKVAINSAWGFGEGVVSGDVTPDDFLVDKVTFDVIRRTIVPKPAAYLLNPATGRVEFLPVPEEDHNKPSLTDDEIRELTQLARRIEKHYGRPMDVEWAVDGDLPFPESIVILQARPETVWSQKRAEAVTKERPKSALDAIVGRLLAGVPVQKAQTTT
ncbi:PEP/pyruvate-binding domain-containing protein [Deferrisoma sp.]